MKNLMNIFTGKTKISEQIENLRLEITSATAMAAQCKTIDEYAYNVRIPLNYRIIEAALGCEFSKNKKGDWVIRYSGNIATKAELSTIAEVVDRFVDEVEIPTLNNLSTGAPDMQISEFSAGLPDGNILIDDKVNTKRLSELILTGPDACLKKRLYGTSVVRLGAMAELAITKRRTVTAVTISAIAVGLLTGGVITMLALKKHNENKGDECSCEDTETLPYDEDEEDVADGTETMVDFEEEALPSESTSMFRSCAFNF